MRQEELVFYKENGARILGKAYIPTGEQEKFPTVIFSHGFGGNYRDLVHHAEGFAENGIACILFDFCGGGLQSLSDGTMQEMTVLTEKEDLTAVLLQTEKLDYVDANHIFLQGESMGGMVSALVAAQMQEQVKALVLWYPAFVIPDDSKKRYEKGDNMCFGMQLCPDFNKASMNIEVFTEIAVYQKPVKIIHGSEDDIVPLSYSQKALTAYKNAELLVISGAGHGFEGTDSQNARESSIAFIKKLVE